MARRSNRRNNRKMTEFHPFFAAQKWVQQKQLMHEEKKAMLEASRQQRRAELEKMRRASLERQARFLGTTPEALQKAKEERAEQSRQYWKGLEGKAERGVKTGAKYGYRGAKVAGKAAKGFLDRLAETAKSLGEEKKSRKTQEKT